MMFFSKTHYVGWPTELIVDKDSKRVYWVTENRDVIQLIDYSDGENLSVAKNEKDHPFLAELLKHITRIQETIFVSRNINKYVEAVIVESGLKTDKKQNVSIDMSLY